LRLSLDSEPTEPGVRSWPPMRTAWPPDSAACLTPRRSAGVAVSSSVPLPLQPLHDGAGRLDEPLEPVLPLPLEPLLLPPPPPPPEFDVPLWVEPWFDRVLWRSSAARRARLMTSRHAVY
jgi:hypothetical protein